MMQHPHLLLGAILAVLCSTLSTVIAAPPTLVYPLQAQRPPVARAGSNWTFALHEGTFSAAGSANATIVHLSLASTLPSWCTFDEATRTFYGTPGKGDLGSTIVSVNAAAAGDGDGATTTTQGSFTLLVVDPKTDPTPTVQLPLAQQLASAAAVSGGGTLTPDGSLKVPPKWSFSFGFEWYTISSSAGDSMFWTAYQKGTTTLPSWITFDNSTVTFNGLAPNPAQKGSWTLVLGASDHYGYVDVWQEFDLVVSEHSFELLGSNAADANNSLAQGVLPPLNATVGGPVNYTITLDGFRIDNSTITRSNLSNVSADFSRTNLGGSTSDALQLETNTSALSIVGAVPADFNSSSSPGLVELTFVDQYNDTLQTNISIRIVPSLFDTTKFPATFGVKEGSNFSEDLSSFVATSKMSSSQRRRSLPSSLSTANLSLSVSPASASSWIALDPSSFTLYGKAPSSGTNATATLDVLDPTTGAISRASFLFTVNADGSGTETSGGDGSAGHGGLSQAAKLGLGLGLGLGLPLLIALLVLLFCCYRRRKRGGAATTKSGGKGPSGGRSGAFNGLVISNPRPLSVGPTSPETAGSSAYGASTVTVVTPSHEQERKSGEKDMAEKPAQLSPPVGTAWATTTRMTAPTLPTSTAPDFARNAAAERESPQRPRRFDVMGMLFRSESGGSILDSIRRAKIKGKGKAEEDEDAPPVPTLPHEHRSSMYGLALGDHGASDVIVVADGGRGSGGDDERRKSTYREATSSPHGSEGSVALAGGRLQDVTGLSGSGRVSSWESGASSSLFYSSSASKSATGSTGPHRRTASRGGSLGSQASFGSMSSLGSGGRRGGAPSIPQRRRDFMPIATQSPLVTPDQSYDASRGAFAGPDASITSSGMYHHDGSVARLGSDDLLDEIRIVGSHSGSTSGSSAGPFNDSTNSGAAQNYSAASREYSFPATEPSQDSLPAPRFVPFTSERRSVPYGAAFASQASLAAAQSGIDEGKEEDQFDQDAVEDAWEDEGQYADEDDRPRPRSGVYVPTDGQGSPTTAAVYYPSGSVYSRASVDTGADSQRLSAAVGGGGGMRYVGSVASTNVSPQVGSSPRYSGASHYSRDPGTPRSDIFSIASSQPTAATSNGPGRTSDASGGGGAMDGRTSWAQKRASSYLEPLRVPVNVDEAFRFVPRLDPPPFASITSSPGRNGPPRATYTAWIDLSRLADDEDEYGQPEEGAAERGAALAPLPDWVRFDPDRIEMLGRAGADDLGSWPVVVIERKSLRTPGSPTRMRTAKERREDNDDVQEQVVGRFELVVQSLLDEQGSEEMLHEREDVGELRIVSY
jgi:axial budding pattern protein 2